MESRIILTQADFSANNIGRYVELLDLTKKVLAKQTQYDEDSEEAIALNTFLQNLTNDGFLGGDNPLLDMLIIPGLASSHGEMLYDIAQKDESGYPLNLMPEPEQTAEENLRCYRPIVNGGKIVAVQRYSNTSMDPAVVNTQSRFSNAAWLKAGNVHNQPLKSYSVILCPNKPTSVTLLKNASATVNFTNTYFSMVNLTTGSRVLYTTSDNPVQTFALVCYNKDEKRFEGIIDDDSFTGETDTNPYLNWINNTTFNQLEIGQFKYTEKAELSLVALGSFIPDNKRSALKGYINTFLTAIHVI